MPHIRLIEPDDADGLLKEEYDAAIERAGKVFNIVKAMSLRPGGAAGVDGDVPRDHVRPFGPHPGRARAARDGHVADERVPLLNAAHADDLRAEGADEELASTRRTTTAQADLEPRVRALCDYAVKLTTIPSSVGLADADALRAHGWDDAAIHDAIQVIGYFNYINRVADAVGIDDEPSGLTGRSRYPGL